MLGTTGNYKPGNNSSPYLYIQPNPLQPEAIRVTFDTEDDFNKWVEAVQIGRKTDE